MNGDPWTLIISGAVVALITYALPKLIEGAFNRRVASVSAESAQESIEAMRWQKAQSYIGEMQVEIERLRAILIRHGIDLNESEPLDTQPLSGKRSWLRSGVIGVIGVWIAVSRWFGDRRK